MRAAVFFLMTPRFAALSIAWNAPERPAASFAFSTPFTASFIAFERRRLNTRRRSATRLAFLAEDVFAMARYYPVARKSARRYHMRMIGHLNGTVTALRPGYAILSCGGVGYQVAATKETLARLAQGSNASLWTYLAVRETALDLYGFSSEDDMRFFELLLTVSGIGPKSALGILDIAAVETLRSAITRGKAEYLTNVSGIGKKTAEKIIVELKDKVGLAAEGAGALRGDEEALEAMRALGYTPAEARDALRQVPDTFQTGTDRLREALKGLGGKQS